MGSSKKVTIGYKYYMGMHLVICHGEVDEVQEIFMGDRSAWSEGALASESISIDSPDLFGGEKKEGGFQGTVDIAMGEAAQPISPYLATQLGTGIPAYRGVLSLILNKCYVSAMVRVPKKISVKVKRVPAKSWYLAKAEILGAGTPGSTDYIPSGSANPVHIIYETLTNKDWGIGLSTSMIDDVSFMAAADILFTENFGISFQLTQQSSIKEFIQTVLTHISAILFTDRSTGKFSLGLIREPLQAELDNAIVLDESNIVELTSFERPSFAEMINEVVVRYRPQGALKDSSVTIQDLAAVEGELGIISQTVDFPGVDNATIAARVALRELRQYSTALAKISFVANREAANLSPGSIVKLDWPDLGITGLVIRVFSIDFGSLVDGSVTISATEDIFSMPTTTYLQDQPTIWSNPVVPAVPVSNQILIEVPYWDLSRNLDVGSFGQLTDDSSFVQLIAQIPPAIASASYQLWTSPQTSFAFAKDAQYAPTAIINAAMDEFTTVVPIIQPGFNVAFVELGTYAYIGSEAVRVDTIDLAGLSITIARGTLDTIPIPHADQSVIYFAQDSDSIDPVEYSQGETVDARALVQTDINTLPLDSALNSQLTLSGRFGNPYPPAQVKIGGSYFPVKINALLDANLSWTHQDRTQQVAGLEDWYSVSVSPEAGVTYTADFFGETDNLIHSETSIAGGNFNYSVSQEAADSNLLDPSTSRVLVTDDLAIASANIIYSSLKNPAVLYADDAALRRLGSNWAMASLGSNFLQTVYIDGTTGALTENSIDPNTSWFDSNTAQDVFDIRSDATYIDNGEAGSQPDWAVLSNLPLAQLDKLDQAKDGGLQAINDQRESAVNQIFSVTSEVSLKFYAGGNSNQKVLFYYNIGVHLITEANFQSGTVATTRQTVDAFHAGRDTLLDASNQTITQAPDPEAPFSSHFGLTSPRPPMRALATGGLLYMIYIGSGNNPYSSAGKNLDISNILNGHLTDIHSTFSLKTKVFTIAATSISEIREVHNYTYVGRSNVTDDRCIEWEHGSTDFRIINSLTGATVSTETYTSAISGMGIDWVTGFIYVIKSSTNTLAKIDFTGTEIDTITVPYTLTHNPTDNEIKVSSGRVYLRVSAGGADVVSVDKNLAGPFGVEALIGVDQLLGVFGTVDYALDIRPDSGIFPTHLNFSNELYDEAGGASTATPGNLPRLNATLRVDLKSTRAGNDSTQTYSHTFERTGYGYNYGNYYGD